MKDIAEKTVIVTGASSGIGREIALAFGRHGARVAVHYRSDEDGAKEVDAAIRDSGGRSQIFGRDLTSSTEAVALADEVLDAFGRVHIVVNSVGGFVSRVPLADADDQFIDAVFDLNARSMLTVTRRLVAHFRAEGGGNVINLTSQAARSGASAGAGAYAATKAYVSTYTRALAKEVAAENIRVNAISPGAPQSRRGLFGSFHITTIFVGTVLGSALIAALNSALGGNVMADWGFRIPFVFGALIALVALPFRARTEETPLFTELQDASTDVPVEVVTVGRRTLVIKLVHTFFLVGMQSAAVYTFTSYLPNFLSKYVTVGGEKVSAGQALWSNTIASLVVIAVVIASGAASDRFGRKPFMLSSCVLVVVLTYPLLQLLLATDSLLVVFVVHAALAASAALFLGCMPAVLVELFPRRIRVTGLSSIYNLASAIFGGFAPLLATALITATGLPAAAGFWVIAAALFSTIAVLVMRETRGGEI